MKRTGWLALAVALSLAIAACSSSGSGGGGLGGSTTTAKAKDACTGKTLEASEVGVTPTDITVTVIADVGSPLSPGLFQGSMDGVKAWAAYVNANGGLACRKVNVVQADSKLSPDEAKNGVTTACRTRSCCSAPPRCSSTTCARPRAARTRPASPPASPTSPSSRPSPSSSARRSRSRSSPTAAAARTRARACAPTRSVTPAIEWFKKNVTTDLHGVFVVPADLPSTITSSTPLFTAIQHDGVKQDAEFGASGS